MKKLFFFSSVIIAILCSCSKTLSDYQTSGFPLVAIKGYIVRDEEGTEMGTIGNPDVQLKYPADSISPELGLICYPNPAVTMMYLLVFHHTYGENLRVWIVPATLSGNVPSNSAILGSMIPGEITKPLIDTTFTETGNDFSTYLRISDFPIGYYRVYLKCNGILLWDNIVFAKSNQIYP